MYFRSTVTLDAHKFENDQAPELPISHYNLHSNSSLHTRMYNIKYIPTRVKEGKNAL